MILPASNTMAGAAPMLLKAAMAMKPTTNRGMTGGRRRSKVSEVMERRRWRRPSTAITGANMRTRASFNTSAAPKAPPPSIPPTATTGPLREWSPLPRARRGRCPARVGLAKGTKGIISEPKMTTKATAVTTSSSLASRTPSAAATAAAPQIEKPEAISRLWATLSRTGWL